MQPEHSAWQHPKESSWNQSNKGQAQQQSPAGQRVSVKLSGCSDAAPPLLVTMQAFKVWWKNPKSEKAALPLFTPGLVMLSLLGLVFFFSGVVSWCCVCIVTADPQQVGHRAHRELLDCWCEANNPPVPRAPLLLQEIIKHCLLLFSQCSQEGD